MAKVSVIYWSGTGNTEMMAEEIAKGLTQEGAEVIVKTVEAASQEDVDVSDIVVMGCPSMGAEVLEEADMQPFVDSTNFEGKKVAMFGSYDWGDGEWMRNWVEDMKGKKAEVLNDGLILHLTPDDNGKQECVDFGISLIK